MTVKKNKQQPGERVVTIISETEWRTVEADGTVVESSRSRPNTDADVLWLCQMVYDLAPGSKVNAQIKAENEAQERKDI
jgi:hypothetical protein